MKYKLYNIERDVSKMYKYDENLSSKCKSCNGKLIIKIFRNKANQRQMGLYCSKCGKYHKFINDDDVFYYVGVGCRIKNTYGNLYGTKIYQLKDITNIAPIKNY